MTGQCIFCGQTHMTDQIKRPEISDNTMKRLQAAGVSEEDHIATMHCSCSRADAYQIRQAQIDSAEENIDILFTQPEIAGLLKEAAALIANGDINSCTVKYDTTTAKISRSGGCNIKVNKSTTNTECLEG